MKILFIYPNAGSQLGFNYGIAHMAGLLKQAGHSLAFWQLCEDLEPLPGEVQFLERLAGEKPDLIALSIVTNQWAYAVQLARWIRKTSEVPLVCGGIHVTVALDEVLDSGLFDMAFRGECEEAFLEYVDKMSRGESLEDVRNVAFLKDGQKQVNPVRPLPVLDRLPFKDYELFDFQKIIDAKNGWVGLMASRGCPFSCTYCFNHRMVADYRKDLACSFSELNYIRRFSVDQVLSEIQFLLDRYEGIRMFIFDDDLFTFDKEHVKAFCRAYKQISRIPFVVNAHVGFFDEETAKALSDAGCRIVKFGIESGSERVRKKVLNRHMSNGSIVRAIQLVESLGMHNSVFLIVGFPYETIEDIMDTVKLVAQAGPGRFRWTFFFPYPGTEAYRLSEEGGYIDFSKMSSLQNFTDHSCLNFGEEQNLFISKVGRIMPWFVNAASGFSVADFYSEKVGKIMELDEREWNRIAPELLDKDREYSERFVSEGLSHYAVKYNRFMGVISDYFIRE